MPRNYSINDTIQQARDQIHQKKINKLQESKEKIIKFTPPKDDIVRFDNDKTVEETDTKKMV
jgi:hypothetical protein